MSNIDKEDIDALIDALEDVIDIAGKNGAQPGELLPYKIFLDYVKELQ